MPRTTSAVTTTVHLYGFLSMSSQKLGRHTRQADNSEAQSRNGIPLRKIFFELSALDESEAFRDDEASESVNL